MDPLAQAIWGGILVGAIFFLWLTWDRVGPAVNGLLGGFARSVESHPSADSGAAARTGAAAEEGDAPQQNAGADPVRGAVRGAPPDVPAGSLVLSAEEAAAVARMVRHNALYPEAKKLDTIQAGWPEIKARSGDPNSRYARASAIYDTLIRPPAPVTPLVGRAVPPGARFAEEPHAAAK